MALRHKAYRTSQNGTRGLCPLVVRNRFALGVEVPVGAVPRGQTLGTFPVGQHQPTTYPRFLATDGV